MLQPDPELGGQATAIARLFNLAVPVIILSSGLYQLPVAALGGSYRLIPPGSLLPAGDASATVIQAVTEAFALALRLATPFVLAGIVWQIALALLSRLVPRLQVYLLAMPGQILGGLALLAMLSGAILAAWGEAVRGGFAQLPGL